MTPIRSGFLLLPGILSVIYLARAGTLDDRSLAVSSFVVGISCLAAVLSSWGHDPLCAPPLYLSLFLLFHFGLVWTVAVSGDSAVSQISPYGYTWVDSPYLQPAVTLASLAALTYAAACVMASRWLLNHRGGQPRTVNPVFNTDESAAAKRTALLGMVMELTGLVILLYTIARLGGVGALFGGYLEFLEAAEKSGVAYGIWALGVGACLTQLGPLRIRRVGVVVFVVFAVVFFPLGLRGSVLFPAAVLLSTRSMVGKRARPITVVIGSLVVLSLASTVRASRVGSPVPVGGSWYDGIVSTITELGFSLRPTIEVLRWHAEGLPHTWFLSFVAVPVRLFEKTTGWHGGPPAVDTRLFNVKIDTLAGPIGGSPVAEGYDAAGVYGVIVVAAALGWVICRISAPDRRDPFHLAVFPVILLPVTVAVRNSFAPVVIQMAVGLVLVCLFSRATSPVKRRAQPVSTR